MNKSALKSFATWSRRKLIEQVKTKAYVYGIDEKSGLQMEENFGQLIINNEKYPLSMKSAFTSLQKQLEQKGYKQLMEEVAYTWFNRIIAIRYMEVHEFLPEKVNVLSSTVGRVDPDILFEYDTMDVKVDEAKVREHLDTGNTEAAYRLLFVAQCNALNSILPFMFEPIQDYTELLLPDFLLDAESVIKTLVQKEELTESFEEIEVIGWLYQYYIAEEKDRVFAQKSKYKKEEIPFATQLFTPKWIVQYMVQNSLGRYWTEAHREDEDLLDNWEYFIKHEEEDFHEKIAPYVNKELKVEDIKLLDPAMGSGHILVYAFEVFYEIYEKCGYPERDIPRLILENNLYGLDIDDRAYQLAAFALVMKAASYSKRFLRSVEREGITLHVASIQETNHVSDEVITYIAQEDTGERYNQVKAFFEQYHNAKIYGSLINITEREIGFIEGRFEQIANNPVHDLFYGQQHEIAKQVLPALIHQTKIMRNEYDVVVMNPPYMGIKNMNKYLGDFVKLYYSDSKSDLFSAFMAKVDYLLKTNGISASITQQSWMFLKSFEKIRINTLSNSLLVNVLHIGSRGFDDLSGEVVQNVAFIIKKMQSLSHPTTYIKLDKFDNTLLKEKEFHNKNNYFKRNQQDFFKIPGAPIAYWIENELLDKFEDFKILNKVADTKVGLFTCNNELFLRYWYEVSKEKIAFNINSNKEAIDSGKKWFFYHKGGISTKWYGKYDYVVNYENDGEEVRKYREKNGQSYSLPGHESYFKEAVTWSTINSGKTAFRISPPGYIYGSKGNGLFPKDNSKIYFYLALLNSSICKEILGLISPTLSLEGGYVNKIPVPDNVSQEIMNKLELYSKECIEIVKSILKDNETSIEYEDIFEDNSHSEIENFFKDYYLKQLNNIRKLNEYEEKIDRLVCDLYNVKSYGDFLSKFDSINKKGFAQKLCSLFIANLTQIKNVKVISLTEKEYRKDDVIHYFKLFLKEKFNLNTIQKNMDWIAEALEMKKDEDAESRIRRYFMDEFFADHCKMYQKRPIYWLVDSGKQKGLRTLIYMHRYTPSTMATIRFEHLQEMQAKYQQEIADLDNRLVNPNLSAADKKKLNAEKISFEKKIDELREFDKRLAEIAAEEIEIDLDDGVKVNYEKFYRGGKGVLAKIK